jgi:hypothetical protein
LNGAWRRILRLHVECEWRRRLVRFQRGADAFRDDGGTRWMKGCSRRRECGSYVTLWACGLLIGLSWVTQLAQAQQFSAGLTISGPGAAAGSTAKFAVAGSKVRIETSALPGDVLIVDAAVPAAYLVRPAQRVFMDSKQTSALTRLFVPLDPADPCRQWQAMAELAGISDSGQWRCVAEGSEIVSGRDTRKFAVTSLRGHSTGWIDAGLKFPIKFETEYGAVFTMRDIKEAPQSTKEFEIPTSYRKFDPRGVIEQMKRSDIWVEPPSGPDVGVR